MAMTRDELIALSVQLETATAYDSIPTIRKNYPRAGADNASGAYLCAFSDANTYGRHHCGFMRIDAVAMWLHVHFTGHGESFGFRKPEMIAHRFEEAVEYARSNRGIRPPRR